jgi:hypothetical protein
VLDQFRGSEGINVPNIKTNYGGSWTHRYLEIWLNSASSSETLIRIDPDTVFNRAIDIPSDQDFFGHYDTQTYGVPFFHGCFFGISLSAAKWLVDSGELLNEKYTTKKTGSLQDIIVADILLRHNKKIVNLFPTINCAWDCEGEEPTIWHPSRKSKNGSFRYRDLIDQKLKNLHR